ncbi:MAG: hypothetical protein GEU88_02335 [Solirubrobacterales bacterium]|nr:hypothetical protein [Solirubrobacterales bacterium]
MRRALVGLIAAGALVAPAAPAAPHGATHSTAVAPPATPSAPATHAASPATHAASSATHAASPATSSDLCLAADPPPISAPARRLRFGITPQLAGTVGTAQGEVVPEDRSKRFAALRELRPPHRALVIRLSRLFMSDGRAAIRRFARRARAYARAGFAVESQIRYHPGPRHEGDMRCWRRFVDRASTALGRTPALVALTVTNEVNLPISENTSDGAYPGAINAILRGIPAARRALDRLGRDDVELGFSYAYRYLPDADAEFWREIGERATPRFRRALDYVGVQIYPGLFWPPRLVTETAGAATVEALTLLRGCWMPKAGLGGGTELWISENGYATNLGHTEARQADELRSTVDAVHAYSGTLGVSDYRYFNLRDNRPNGTDLFDDVGLLRADYSRKRAFGAYRGLIRELGDR